MNNPVAPEIEFEDLVTVEVPCSINGTYKAAFHTAAFAAWLAGASLADAFPDTDAIDRNVLVGGPTPAEAEAQPYPATVPAFYGREVVDRKCVVPGKRGSVRVDLGGRLSLKK